MSNEPAAVSTIVVAAIGFVTLIVFNRELSTEETAAIVGVVTLIGGFWTRSRVTPVG